MCFPLFLPHDGFLRLVTIEGIEGAAALLLVTMDDAVFRELLAASRHRMARVLIQPGPFFHVFPHDPTLGIMEVDVVKMFDDEFLEAWCRGHRVR